MRKQLFSLVLLCMLYLCMPQATQAQNWRNGGWNRQYQGRYWNDYRRQRRTRNRVTFVFSYGYGSRYERFYQPGYYQRYEYDGYRYGRSPIYTGLGALRGQFPYCNQRRGIW